MRTKYFFLLFFLVAVLLLPAQESQKTQNTPDNPDKTAVTPGAPNTEEQPAVKKPRKFDIDIAYVFREESKVVTETDLHCTHFIADHQSEDIIITGSEMMTWGKIDYADHDRMFINKGSNSGIKDMDVFLVLGKGAKIYHPVTGKLLGTYYLKKSLAQVYCLYEDKAVITLMSGCQPVQIGDIVIPYKTMEPIFKKKLDYQLCRLPKGGVEGRVVVANIYTNLDRQMASEGQYVTVDIGNSVTSVGDWLIFYIFIRPDLPPVIAGVGIVIDTQNTCSTVKVVDSTHPVEVGMPVVMMPTEKGGATPLATTTSPTSGSEEKLPTMDGLRTADGSPAGDVLNIDVLFDMNDATLKEAFKPELEKISTFVADKSQYIIILRGYACSVGGLEYNLKLSQTRVETIKKYIMETFNIKEELIEASFYGEKDPVYDNSTETERRKNRRVSIEVRGTK